MSKLDLTEYFLMWFANFGINLNFTKERVDLELGLSIV
jgi:hypothetical protein